MIKTEFLETRSDGVKLYKTYSDANLMIEQQPTGYKYRQAIDIEGAPYTYIETDEEIKEPEEKPNPMERKKEAKPHGHN